eukprot:355806_1
MTLERRFAEGLRTIPTLEVCGIRAQICDLSAEQEVKKSLSSDPSFIGIHRARRQIGRTNRRSSAKSHFENYSHLPQRISKKHLARTLHDYEESVLLQARTRAKKRGISFRPHSAPLGAVSLKSAGSGSKKSGSKDSKRGKSKIRPQSAFGCAVSSKRTLLAKNMSSAQLNLYKVDKAEPANLDLCRTKEKEKVELFSRSYLNKSAQSANSIFESLSNNPKLKLISGDLEFAIVQVKTVRMVGKKEILILL